MVVTHSGITGHNAVGHAQEEFRVAHIPAPIPLLQTEEQTVEEKDLLQDLKNAINTTATVNTWRKQIEPGLNYSAPTLLDGLTYNMHVYFASIFPNNEENVRAHYMLNHQKRDLLIRNVSLVI